MGENYLTYLDLDMETQRDIFVANKLDHILIDAYNALFDAKVQKSADASNIFNKILENEKEINNYIEKTLQVCADFDSRWNTVELQNYHYNHFDDKETFFICLEVSMQKKYFEKSEVQYRIENRIYGLEKKGLYKGKERLRKEFNFAPDKLYSAGVFYLMNFVYQYALNIFHPNLDTSHQFKMCGWKMAEIINRYSWLLIQLGNLIILANKNNHQKEAGKESKNKADAALKTTFEKFLPNWNAGKYDQKSYAEVIEDIQADTSVGRINAINLYKQANCLRKRISIRNKVTTED